MNDFQNYSSASAQQNDATNKAENNPEKSTSSEGAMSNICDLKERKHDILSRMLVLEFADAKVPVHSMQITPTYKGFLEGIPQKITAHILDREQYMATCNGDGYRFVAPQPNPNGTMPRLGRWRFEITIEYWDRSAQENGYCDQLYTLTLVFFAHKISDDRMPLSQHLSQYTRDLHFLDLAHKCTEEETLS